MMKSPPDLLGQASAAPATREIAARILPLVDLTALGEDEREDQIEALCARAADVGVAAVCVWPRFVPAARRALERSGVKVATVANFPGGGDDIARALAETEAAVEAGADEVDLVAPLGAILEGDVGLVSEMVQACKAALDGRILKVILETGRLGAPPVITAAARAAIMAGAGFLKTSTGKAAVGATLEAAAVLLAVIDEAEGRVGIKLSGGIRTTQHAAQYLYLIDHFMAPGWVEPRTVRFGASPPLVDDLVAVLNAPP
jgi:deoxyribose-phosphate aldolase